MKNNWLNNIEIENEWTLTQKEIIEEIIEEEELPLEEENTDNPENETNEELPPETTEEETSPDEELTEQIEEIEKIEKINYAYSIGNKINENDVKDLLDIRPVVYLKSRMLLVGGNGTFESPYILK